MIKEKEKIQERSLWVMADPEVSNFRHHICHLRKINCLRSLYIARRLYLELLIILGVAVIWIYLHLTGQRRSCRCSSVAAHRIGELEITLRFNFRQCIH